MQRSGNKLVVVLCLLALAAGAVGWSYRYKAAHRAAEFWGPTAARLLRGPSMVHLFDVQVDLSGSSDGAGLGAAAFSAGKDVSQARGLNHLRNALSLDLSFHWEEAVPAMPVDWAVGLRFSQGDEEATVLFSRDFRVLGKVIQAGEAIKMVSCVPVSDSLTTYFKSLE